VPVFWVVMKGELVGRYFINSSEEHAASVFSIEVLVSTGKSLRCYNLEHQHRRLTGGGGGGGGECGWLLPSA
jgi:hypothetical protein